MGKGLKKDIEEKSKTLQHQYTFTDLTQAAMDLAYCAFVNHPCDEGIEIMNHLMEIKVMLNRRKK